MTKNSKKVFGFPRYGKVVHTGYRLFFGMSIFFLVVALITVDVFWIIITCSGLFFCKNYFDEYAKDRFRE